MYLSGYHGQSVHPVWMWEHTDRLRGPVTVVRVHSMLGRAPLGLVLAGVVTVVPATHSSCVLSLFHREMEVTRMMVAVVPCSAQGYSGAQEMLCFFAD